VHAILLEMSFLLNVTMKEFVFQPKLTSWKKR